jgi:hypothetical protein
LLRELFVRELRLSAREENDQQCQPPRLGKSNPAEGKKRAQDAKRQNEAVTSASGHNCCGYLIRNFRELAGFSFRLVMAGFLQHTLS